MGAIVTACAVRSDGPMITFSDLHDNFGPKVLFVPRRVDQPFDQRPRESR